jgi:hypothetical protein
MGRGAELGHTVRRHSLEIWLAGTTIPTASAAHLHCAPSLVALNLSLPRPVTKQQAGSEQQAGRGEKDTKSANDAGAGKEHGNLFGVP